MGMYMEETGSKSQCVPDAPEQTRDGKTIEASRSDSGRTDPAAAADSTGAGGDSCSNQRDDKSCEVKESLEPLTSREAQVAKNEAAVREYAGKLRAWVIP